MRVKLTEKLNRTIKKEYSPKQQLALRVVFSIVVAFMMGVLIEIARLGIKDFFSSLGSGRLWLEMGCVTAIITIVLLIIVAYLVINKKQSPQYESKVFRIILVSMFVTFLISLLTVHLFNEILIMPIALSGLIIAALVGRRLGLIVNVLLNQAFYISYVMLFGGDFIFETATALLVSVIGGTILILMIPKSSSRIRYLGAGLLVSLLTACVGMISSTLKNTDFIDILTDGLWAFASTFLSVALFIVVSPFFEVVFNVGTTFRLNEICSFNAPLLKRLANEAPGTFNHSIMVANLAELCALNIGENSVLAKAAGYYHDVGKLSNPKCFIENQTDGVNPHDDYIPEVSVQLIVNHTGDGYELIKKAHLPDVLADVCLEHHGTTAVNYFYYKVQSLARRDVDKENFVYGGPKPQSKIAAIIMIVDTVEAATRAKEGGFDGEKELRSFIHTLIKAKEEEGQFSECSLTTSDMAKIEDTLTFAIPNISHKRIEY